MGAIARAMKWVLLATALLIAFVQADQPAANDLPTMVAWINSGKFHNNFFDGGIVGAAATDAQKVGGCLLDKVGAIKNEDGLEKFPNDLKVDLAACCTKGGAQCVQEIAPAYNALVAQTSGTSGQS